jgi:acid phosphatase
MIAGRRLTPEPCQQSSAGALLAMVAVVAFCANAALTGCARPAGVAASSLPAPAHVVVVVEETFSYDQIVGNRSAPYINWLAQNGALMTQSSAITHPSQPNYLALFAGSTFGFNDDCSATLGAIPNLGSELLAAGYTFMGFSEDLPSAGSTTCTSGKYARRHVPWTNFSNVPAANSVPFSSFPSDYASLPTVSFVIPNLDNDMHDGTIAEGDAWLYKNLSAYAAWAKSNNSLLVVTWDEAEKSESNHIPTIFYGGNVRTGTYSEPVSHYNVLSTLEGLYGLEKTGYAASAPAITDIWLTSKPTPAAARP